MSRFKLALTRSPRAYSLLRRAAVVGRYLARRPHEHDFAAFRLLLPREGVFLDVGANSGQSALSFRLYDRFMPILSIEPLPEHRRDLDLVKRLIPRFEYMIFAAGTAPGRASIRVPRYGDIALTGEASMSGVEGGSAWSLEQLGTDAAHELSYDDVEVEVRPLDELGVAPGFVKIDVEGFELSVLKGMERTLREHKPVLMIERSSGHEEVRRHLEGMGYAGHFFDQDSEQLVPLAGERPQNVFYVPED